LRLYSYWCRPKKCEKLVLLVKCILFFLEFILSWENNIIEIKVLNDNFLLWHWLLCTFTFSFFFAAWFLLISMNDRIVYWSNIFYSARTAITLNFRIRLQWLALWYFLLLKSITMITYSFERTHFHFKFLIVVIRRPRPFL